MASEMEIPGMEENAKEVLEEMLSLMGVEAKVSFHDEQDHLLLSVATEDHQILIGKRGQTLDAIQFILNRIVGRSRPGGKRIVVDCEKYRERRSEQLKRMAREVAERVRKEKIPYAFDASLTPAERRIIHMELLEEPEIFTRSEGENEDRRLVVLPRLGDDE